MAGQLKKSTRAITEYELLSRLVRQMPRLLLPAKPVKDDDDGDGLHCVGPKTSFVSNALLLNLK